MREWEYWLGPTRADGIPVPQHAYFASIGAAHHTMAAGSRARGHAHSSHGGAGHIHAGSGRGGHGHGHASHITHIVIHCDVEAGGRLKLSKYAASKGRRRGTGTQIDGGEEDEEEEDVR